MSQATSRLNPIVVAIVAFFGFVTVVLVLSALQLATLPSLQAFDRSLHAVRSVTPKAGDNQRLTQAQWAALAAQIDVVVAAQRDVPRVDALTADPLVAAFKGLRFSWGVGPELQPRLRAFHTVLDRTISTSERSLKHRLKTLQVFQWAALATGILLLTGLILHLFRNYGREERAVATAQQETHHILSTVTEGLFLLDRNLVIGAEFSGVTADILRRTDLGGMSLEHLLKDMVPTRTLTLALDFVKLLWSDHVEPELVDDINPLGEVEVHLREANGQFDTRYLKFGFKRVTGASGGEILVSVTDISEAVRLRRELEKAQAESEAQMDLLMSILHVDATQLQSFLSDSVVSLNNVNAQLKIPAHRHEEFRDKVDSTFRTIHSIKSDAAGLGLASIESKAHVFEEDLQQLRLEKDLSGREMLGLPIKLDELMTHFHAIESLVGRLTSLRSAFSQGATQRIEAFKVDSVTEDLLKSIAQQVGRDVGKQIDLQCAGLHHLPAAFRTPLKDVLVQLVRNAVVHGIEPTDERLQEGKPGPGNILVRCVARAGGGLRLTVEDDGKGISANHIRVAAVKRGMMSLPEATKLTGAELIELLFKPGFSTVLKADENAGRGVGLDVVKATVQGLGGRVRLSGRRGEGTRFTIELPPVSAQRAA
jgi:signal transduction histidine kinase